MDICSASCPGTYVVHEHGVLILGVRDEARHWAEARSQKTLNAPQSRVEFIQYGIFKLGSDPVGFVGQTGQPGRPEEVGPEAKGCCKNCPDLDDGGLNCGSSQGMDLRRTQ